MTIPLKWLILYFLITCPATFLLGLWLGRRPLLWLNTFSGPGLWWVAIHDYGIMAGKCKPWCAHLRVLGWHVRMTWPGKGDPCR